jgi:hypothetical protein
MRTLIVLSDMAGEMGGLGDLWGSGDVGLLGGRGVAKSSSCSGLLDSIRSPRGRGIRGSGSICSLRGRGSGASLMCSEREGGGVFVRWVSNGREEVGTKGEEKVGGGVVIWICQMVMELRE